MGKVQPTTLETLDVVEKEAKAAQKKAGSQTTLLGQAVVLLAQCVIEVIGVQRQQEQRLAKIEEWKLSGHSVYGGRH